MIIAFRADASIDIGTGHIMRCLALADGLNRYGHECYFICRRHQGNLGRIIEDKGYRTFMLSLPDRTESDENRKEFEKYAHWLAVSWQHDAEETAKAVRGLKVDWLIVDHYGLDARWEKKLADYVNHIAVIDDLANRQHKCDLLLDQNLGRLSSDYDGLLIEKSERLIGPRYALLRPEFALLRKRSLERRANPRLNRFLISMGGVDRSNMTGKVLEALSNSLLPANTELDIIIGVASPNLAAVWEQASRLRFKVMLSMNVMNMAERMSIADLSIGAAGGTSWERCCLGLPSILVILAENQIASANALEVSGAAMLIVRAQEIEAVLPKLLVELSCPSTLERMSSVAAEITEGKGISSVMHSLCVIAGRS